MAKIKVGIFVPYSGVYRNLKSDFLNGVEAAIPETLKKDIVFIPEFVQTGGLKQVEDAFRKLALFESVDLLTGIISTSVLVNLLQSINTEKIPSIINNLGGYIPTEVLASPYLFYNSLHLWKSEWVLGKWMQSEFGGVPAIGTHVYDGGYNLHECFRKGTVAGGADECRLHVLKLEGLQGFADTKPLVDVFKYDNPSHAHAILSGKEGIEFINNFYADNVAAEIPLSVSPVMVNSGDLFNLSKPTAIFNAITWDYNIDSTENKIFKTDYEHNFQEAPNVFSLLGYETGLAIVVALEKFNDSRVTREKLAEALIAANDVIGPRGKLNIGTMNFNTSQPVYIRNANINVDQVTNQITDVVYDGIEWNAHSLATVREASHSWQNPYLCV